jgi:hypothetical protein
MENNSVCTIRLIEMAAPNSTFAISGVTCSAYTFVVNENLVLLNYICAERHQLLVAANRYRKVSQADRYSDN